MVLLLTDTSLILPYIGTPHTSLWCACSRKALSIEDEMPIKHIRNQKLQLGFSGSMRPACGLSRVYLPDRLLFRVDEPNLTPFAQSHCLQASNGSVCGTPSCLSFWKYPTTVQYKTLHVKSLPRYIFTCLSICPSGLVPR